MSELISKLESGENGCHLEEGSSTNISENGDSNLTASGKFKFFMILYCIVSSFQLFLRV